MTTEVMLKDTTTLGTLEPVGYSNRHFTCIAGLLDLAKQQFQHTLQQLGRNYFIRYGQRPKDLTKNDIAVWVEFIERHAFPLNEAVLAALLTLLPELETHEYHFVLEFAAYQHLWVEAHLRWKMGLDHDIYRLVSPQGNFPANLESWVQSKARLEVL